MACEEVAASIPRDFLQKMRPRVEYTGVDPQEVKLGRKRVDGDYQVVMEY